MTKFVFSPDQRAEATVVLDALLEGRLHTDRSPEGVGLRATTSKLMRCAWDAYRSVYPRATRAGVDGDSWRRWTSRCGMIECYRRGEHDYVCMYCRIDVATLNNRGGQLPWAFVDKLTRHGTECAMRFVMGGFEPRGPRRGDRR